MSKTITTQTIDRAMGAIIGLAIGDALGTSFEGGRKRDPLAPLAMTGGGPHHLEAGQWTDDTSLMLCLMDSLIANNGKLNPKDVMTRFARWFEQGENSCVGKAFDIGRATHGSIEEYRSTGKPMAGQSGRDTAGNGGIMRLSPIIVANLLNIDHAAKAAIQQSRLTHAAPQCLDAAAFMARILYTLIHDENCLDPSNPSSQKLIEFNPQEIEFQNLSQGSHVTQSRDNIRSTGYVIDTLTAALWCCARHTNFTSAMTEAVNLGGDADTLGAVTGQLAGATYGLSAIPSDWLDRLAWREDIKTRARKLVEIGTTPKRKSIFSYFST